MSIAQDYYEYKIIPEDNGWGTMFGTHVSSNNFQFATNNKTVDGNYEVQFYANSNGGWELTNSINIEYLNAVVHQQLEDDFYILSMSGNANSTPPQNFHPGKLKIYANYDGDWTLIQIINNPDADNYMQFGQGFFRNNELMIINSKHREEDIVKLYVYRYVENNWVVEFSYEINQEYIGSTNLYIDENQIIYGDYSADLTDENSYEGRVLIFDRINDIWQLNTTLTSNPMIIEGGFGFSISYYDGTLFVGAYNEINKTGAVYVFNKIDGVWTQVQRLLASDFSPNSRFGYNIKVNENSLLINAPFNNDAGPGSGSVYIFNENNENQWTESRKICSSDLAMMDEFGGSIGFVNDYIVASAPMKNNMSGAIYIYHLADTMLHSNFATYPVTGNAPLTLSFNDLSQGYPTVWQWDFDSDGIIDSEEQYPEHTYEFSADYTITLTVTNDEETSTFTKENYISVSGGLAYGDLNGDTTVDVIDIVIMVDVIMGEVEPTVTQIEAADMNNSGTIDIIDIVLVVNEILGG